MHFHLNHKIDLNEEYPCPCRRKGKLSPILLTEAMGCDLCQQIFVVTETGKEIEQLSSVYPYKRRWCWNGKRWIINGMWGLKIYAPLITWLTLILLIISIPIIIKFSESLALVVGAIIVLLLILVSLYLWRSSRH